MSLVFFEDSIELFDGVFVAPRQIVSASDRVEDIESFWFGFIGLFVEFDGFVDLTAFEFDVSHVDSGDDVVGCE